MSIITIFKGGSVTDKLQEVYKPIISDAECGSKVSGFHSTTMICAGLPYGGVDACQVGICFYVATWSILHLHIKYKIHGKLKSYCVV
jgi:hypothetical protein